MTAFSMHEAQPSAILKCHEIKSTFVYFLQKTILNLDI